MLLPAFAFGTGRPHGCTPWSLRGAEALSGAFYENRGQLVDAFGRSHPEVRFYAFFDGAQVFFTAKGWHVAYATPGVPSLPGIEMHGMRHLPGLASSIEEDAGPQWYRMDVTLAGCNTDVRIEALQQEMRLLHYYLPHCEEGITRVRAFRCLRYRNVYDHVDLVLYAASEGLKYEFEVHPGGRVDDIRLQQGGTTGMAQQPDGSVIVRWPRGYTQEGRPYCYTRDGDEMHPVVSAWRIEGTGLRFAVDGHDDTKTLVLDPWSTYYGGTSQDYFQAICCDRDGAVIATGSTYSVNFPVHQAWQAGKCALQDVTTVMVVKLDSAGRPAYATFYGGSGDQNGLGVTALADKSCAVVGGTNSSNFPVYHAFQPQKAASLPGYEYDAVIIALDSIGTRRWATYFGGSGMDVLACVSSDAAGNIYAGGGVYTSAVICDLPLLNPRQSTSDWCSGFYLKMDSTGRLLGSSFIGGPGQDAVWGIAAAPSGAFALCGITSSGSFPVLHAQQDTLGGIGRSGWGDGFVGAFDNTGTARWVTYHGGTDADICYGIAMDARGHVIVCGETYSADLPVLHATQPLQRGGYDALVAKYDSAGQMLFSTYYGGEATDYATSIAVDDAGFCYVTGRTYSNQFPVMRAHYPIYKGVGDGFVVKLDSTGQPHFATYLGGRGADDMYGIACDKRGNAFVAGFSESKDYPVLNAVQDTLATLPSSQEADGVITCVRSDGTVPVILLRLSAHRAGAAAVLDWCTESEVNVFGFAIERREADAMDGARTPGWTDVGFVPANGSGSAGYTYQFTDTDPALGRGRLSYRLRMLDLGGAREYSPVVSVGPEPDDELAGFDAVYPSPVRDWLTLNLSLPVAGSVTLAIYDVSGNIVARVYDGNAIAAGRQSVVLPVAQWRSGLYLARLTVSGRTIVRRVLVLR